MAKFYGGVGYAEENVPIRPGVYEDRIVEFKYHGDVLRNIRQLGEGEPINSDISVSNSISIVADAYANEHFFAIRYIRWMGVCWAIREVDVQRPRLILKLGGVYNGPKAPTAESFGENSGGSEGVLPAP